MSSGRSIEKGRLRAALLLVLIPLLAAACSGGGSGTASKKATCQKPPAGIGPDATATLTDADQSGTWCLKKGDVLTVYLKVPLAAQDRGWAPIKVSSTSVLTRRPGGVQTLVRGVTAGIFEAKATGTATLTSSRPDGATWTATIVVRS